MMELKGSKAAGSLLSDLQKSSYSKYFDVGLIEHTSDVISTGSLGLDLITVIGGFPRGRVSLIRGWESASKTTHALKAAANLQALGGGVAFIDTEYALDPAWAVQQGVNMKEMLWLQPQDLETAGEMAVDLAESGKVDLIIFDSVAGAPIKAVVDGDLGDANMGIRAKIMSSFMPKLNGPLARNKIWMIFTNQLRDSLNMYSPKPVSPGGHALNFHSSLTIDLRAKKIRQPGGDVTHSEITALVEKNKLGPPGRTITYRMELDGSIDEIDELVTIATTPEYAERLGVERRGAWYVFPEGMMPGEKESDRRFNGRGAVSEAMSDLDVFAAARAYALKKL